MRLEKKFMHAVVLSLDSTAINFIKISMGNKDAHHLKHVQIYQTNSAMEMIQTVKNLIFSNVKTTAHAFLPLWFVMAI